MKKFRIENLKITIIITLILLCQFISYYGHFILESEKIFAHFFYIPIIMAAFWWGYRGLLVTLVLSLIIFITHILSPIEGQLWISLIRIFLFFLIGTLVSFLVHHRNKLLVNLNNTNTSLNNEIIERKKIEEELTDHKINLEKLVKERTDKIKTINEELTISNDELYRINKELIESNDKLNRANKDLEDFNALFIGREFRIKELREEIKELKAKL